VPTQSKLVAQLVPHCAQTTHSPEAFFLAATAVHRSSAQNRKVPPRHRSVGQLVPLCSELNNVASKQKGVNFMQVSRGVDVFIFLTDVMCIFHWLWAARNQLILTVSNASAHGWGHSVLSHGIVHRSYLA
jgi:hypothetical protein